MERVDTSRILKIEYLKKLMIVKEHLHKYNNIYCRIVELYYMIEQEYIRFEYVYKNINYVNVDSYLFRIIADLNFNILTLTVNNKFMLEYNSTAFDKFIYIISIAVNLDIDTKVLEIIINKYLPKIINYGKTYDVINACLLCSNIDNQDIIINFNYHDGLIECLNLSPRWDELILYFHNKQLINRFHLKDVFDEVTSYLLSKNDDYSYNTMIDLLGDKSDPFLPNSY